MDKQILIATFNQNKVEEIMAIAEELGFKFKFSYLRDYPNIVEVIEDGNSFQDNAVKKARGYFRQTGLITLAEDSGLCVDSLGGLPGVRSSRFAGEEKDDYKNNVKLLELLKNKSDRRAEFICVVAVALNEDEVKIFEGRLKGRIANEMRGKYGFGYDPVFIPEGYDKTIAELGPEIKNKISHRRKAIQKALEFLGSLRKGPL